VSAPAREVLHVRLVRRVHADLTLDVEFSLGRETGVIFGPSGAGKTTLLRLIAGLATPDSGRVQLEEASLFDSRTKIDQPLRRRRVGMIFQDDCLFPHLNVAANIRFGLRGWNRTDADARLHEVAALCGVQDLLERRPETLSGGERQRVGLARALAPKPRLLLCDEPLSALDLASRHALCERLRAVQRALAIPLLYVTHSPSEALALGARLFLLDQGRIVADGTPLDVLSKARRSSSGTIPWEGIRNVFPGCVVDHAPNHGATRFQVEDGPVLLVPELERSPGTRLLVEVRADDIILARESIRGLSARNQIPGIIERLVPHGTEAEALVRTLGVTWFVSLVSPAAEQLELAPGSPVHLVIKARSCHVISGLAPPPSSERTG
jgi:molybdate transport system ATP-binding protein